MALPPQGPERPPSAGDQAQGGDPACWAHLFDEEVDGADVPARPDLIGREGIEVLVRSFYRQAAMDERLGPVFIAADVDWPAHIATLIDFWSWQLFGERGYEGNPLLAHRPLQAATPFTPAHYERWLELFDETVDDNFRGPMADTAKLRAAKMAAALERLMDGVTAEGDVPIDVTVVRPAHESPAPHHPAA